MSGSQTSLQPRNKISMKSKNIQDSEPQDLPAETNGVPETETKPGKPSNGVRATKIVKEKENCLDDAIFIYKKMRREVSGCLPIFLQRNLTYRPTRKARQTRASLSEVLKRLEPTRCSSVNVDLEKITNLKDIVDAYSLTLDVYLQKLCYKRRKTDVTIKERHLGKYKLDNSAVNGEEVIHSITLDINEITSDIGNHYIDSSYLKYRLLIVKERNSKHQPTAAKRPRRTFLSPENRFRTKELSASMVLFSNTGSETLPSGSHTLLLKSENRKNNDAQIKSVNDVQSMPSIHLTVRRKLIQAEHSKSKHKVKHLTNGGLTNSININGLEAPVTPKVYLVINYRGNPQTLVQSNYNCPLCFLKVYPQSLVYLLKHLRLCHARLNFLFRELDCVIDVSINKSYDGHNEGNPLSSALYYHQLHLNDLKQGVHQPIRRMPQTTVINYKAKRYQVKLEEFTKQPVNNTQLNSQTIGCNRLYVHSVSNQVIMPAEFDEDSDGDDLFLTSTKSNRLIDEFIDINKGEKTVIKLWNTFVFRNPSLISDFQIEEGVMKFIKDNAVRLATHRNNFMCHLSTLYDSGILRSNQISNIIQYMNSVYTK